MGREKQSKVIEVGRGLFLVRYATAADEHEPPKISLSVDRDSKNSLQFVMPPGETETSLWRPGGCIVLRAAAPGKLIVEVEPLPGSRSASSTVRVEPLDVGRLSPALPANLERVDLAGLALIGHVAGRGDVRVAADEWLAGPAAPSRIEGLVIDWPGRPQGVNIHYAVSTAKPQANSQKVLSLGEFAGTRGKALPLVGLGFELIGEGAAEFQLAVEAIFLGAPASRIVGRRISLAGPTGREPLVGLKISAEKVASAINIASVDPKGTAGRVRVFRGRPKSTSADPPAARRAAKAG
jgi:hypothetical protein